MGFAQESRAEAAVAALRAMSAAEATVIRNGQRRRIPAADLVPGDILLVEEGDRIPADGRVIESVALQTAEAALTGESLPVSKDSAVIAGSVPLGDRSNMLVIPSAVYYVPKFTYVWTLAIGRFPDALRRRVSRSVALREIARCFLAGAGATVPGELARVTGLSRPDAGLGNRALVKEGFAVMTGPGHYRLAGSW